ncbi:flagellar basal-body rod protein FlgF [Candidatus Desantisbacteria bacterium]|nr:flagellar basal-body rod protein FlgF [Candidatus Desantisbacteria bacterium]
MMEGINRLVTGMEQEARKLEIVTNNLANISTPSFKKVLVEYTGTSESNSADNKNAENKNCFMITDFSQGMITNTNNPADLAIDGDGFFVIETPSGTRYTRDGSFKISGDGKLMTYDDNFVLDEQNRPITVGSTKFEVGTNGEIIVNGIKTAKLKLVSFEKNNRLLKAGHNFYESNGMTEINASPQVLQGSIESSNVNTMMEMCNMINIMRKYESYQKMMQFLNESIQSANREVGRVS